MSTSEKRISIRDWSEADRPREKLQQKGRYHVSEVELLAIIIGSGTDQESALDLSRRILQSCGNRLEKLGKLNWRQLQNFRGIGPAKAINIMAALELGRRRKRIRGRLGARIKSSSDVFNLMRPFFVDLHHEEFWMTCLNQANRVISNIRISHGGVSATIADPRLIFKSAVEQLASSVIFSHNHPSGSTRPSNADVKLTRHLITAGDVLDIDVLDHLIISDHGFYSFADAGMI